MARRKANDGAAAQLELVGGPPAPSSCSGSAVAGNDPDAAGFAALGKNTNNVTPSGLLPGGQTVLFGPAQLDFSGRPLEPPQRSQELVDLETPADLGAAVLAAPVDPRQLDLGISEGRQLELREHRDARFRLRDGLRWQHTRSRLRKCGRVRIDQVVRIRIVDGHAHFDDVVRCGSVWECPTCSSRICAERAEELQTVVKWHRESRVLSNGDVGGEVYLLTNTFSHARHHDAKTIVRGVSNAHRAMIRDKRWRAFADRHELQGYVRGLEVTLGTSNGFHPHLHTLLFLPRLQPKQLAEMKRWINRKWTSAVVSVLGEEHCPDEAHGTDLRDAHRTDYLAKLGLEVTGGGAKRGRRGSRTPWQLAADLVQHGRAEDRVWWSQYTDAMFGRRQLTWSKGLRAEAEAAGIIGAEKSDEEIVEAADAKEEHVCEIAGDVFDVVRDQHGALSLLLAMAETHGAAGVERTIRELLRRALGDDGVLPMPMVRGPPE